VLGGQLSQARSKPDPVDRVRTAHYIGVHYNVHNYDAQQHRAGQIISPLTLHTINIAQMLSVGGEGECYHRTLICKWYGLLNTTIYLLQVFHFWPYVDLFISDLTTVRSFTYYSLFKSDSLYSSCAAVDKIWVNLQHVVVCIW